MEKLNGTEANYSEKNEFSGSLESLQRAHSIFLQRVKQELKRAERYCEFLSLLVIDFSGLQKFPLKNHLKNLGAKPQFWDELEKWVRKNVRETDIVSRIEKDKLGLLLAETPKEGANNLAKRLKESIKSQLEHLFQAPSQWMVPVDIISFPDKEQGTEEFLGIADRYFSK